MKTFTLEQANALVPQLAELLDDLSDARDKIMLMGASLQPMLQRAGGNGGSKAGGEYVLVLQRFNAGLSCVQDLGCQLKDLDRGLVDFPTYRQGELVLLCWERGETEITFWHSLDAGYGGRQPL